MVKASAYNVGDPRSIPGSGKMQKIDGKYTKIYFKKSFLVWVYALLFFSFSLKSLSVLYSARVLFL